MGKCIVRLFVLIYIIKYCQCNEYLLPGEVIPKRYKLKLVSYLDEGGPHDFTYDGEVKIKVSTIRETQKITLHCHELNISNIYVKNADTKRDIEVDYFNINKNYDFLNIYLKDALETSEEYILTIHFKGSISGDLVGYYRSSYKNDQNETKWLATTQFESTYARYAFPCFDEPAYKASFVIKLGHSKHLTAISNMPKKKTVPMNNNNFVLDIFEESVPMSTYLVAFVISDFAFESSPSHLSKTLFRIWARPNALPQIEFAKKTGPRSLTYYENFFNISFPLPKQDMIAIPDFSSGAMENWGLVTYREVALLYDPKVGNIANLNRIAEVICHELAHQWFGNLVTMKWWTDIWLNEGFATYMALLCVNNLFPEWKSMKQTVLNNMNTVYSLDSLKSSHPISVPVENPYKIDEIFDFISYKKGSTIIRMMGSYLGLNVLQEGVTNYLNKHAYSNAEQDDLWRSLTEVARKYEVIPYHFTVKHIMDTWTLQTGYPVIYVHRNYNESTFSVTQKRFFKQISSKDINDSCWYIPLTYTDGHVRDFESTKARSWLTCPKKITEFADPNSKTWLIFNIQVSGLYRVNYDTKNWEMLIDQLHSDQYDIIDELSRCALINDAMSLAHSGEMSYDTAFNLVDYVKHDSAYLPWKVAVSRFGQIAHYLERTDGFNLIKHHIKNLVEPVFKYLGGFNILPRFAEQADEIDFQTNIVRTSCYYGVQNCIVNATSLFKSYKQNPDHNPINTNMRLAAYCYGVKYGTQKDWDFLWKQYLESNVATEKSIMLRALGCSNDPKILQRFIGKILNEKSGIRAHDAYVVFDSIASNTVGFEIAKKFLYNNGEALMNLVKPRGSKIGYFVDSVARNIMFETEVKKFNEFLVKHPDIEKYAKIGIQQSKEKIEINLQWHKIHYDNIIDILKTRKL